VIQEKGRSLMGRFIGWFFVVMERKLIEMPLPNDFDQEIRMASSLSVLEELFNFCAIDYDNNRVEI
jgi:hypothetical protein